LESGPEGIFGTVFFKTSLNTYWTSLEVGGVVFGVETHWQNCCGLWNNCQCSGFYHI